MAYAVSGSAGPFPGKARGLAATRAADILTSLHALEACQPTVCRGWVAVDDLPLGAHLPSGGHFVQCSAGTGGLAAPGVADAIRAAFRGQRMGRDTPRA